MLRRDRSIQWAPRVKQLATSGLVELALLLGASACCAALAQPNYTQPTIVGTKHDLNWAYTADGGISPGMHSFNDYREVCVYCHTPHHADASQGALWNRQAPSGPYTLYDSPTLREVAGLPQPPGRSSQLCLSCHDGTLAVDLILNVPTYDLGTVTTKHGAMTVAGTDSWLNCGTYCHGPTQLTWHRAERAYLTTDMSNDHPVGVAYPVSPKYAPPPPDGKFGNGVRLIEGKVECVSCHNPHNPVIRPFLVTSDDGSALCYTCHAK